MSDYRSLKHTKWECKYHVVFIPKCRRKVLYGKIRQRLGQVFNELAKRRESEIIEGHLCPDHVHTLDYFRPEIIVRLLVFGIATGLQTKGHSNREHCGFLRQALFCYYRRE